MNTVYFSKVRNDAKIPCKDKENAGYDIYACFKEQYVAIPPHTVRLIPTGIASCFSEDYVMVLKERGSTGSKNLGQRSGVIDASYRGEWFVPLSNLSDTWVFITKLTKEATINKQCVTPENRDTYENGLFYPYDKAICQALLLPVPETEIKEISYDELMKFESTRMTGCLGSSEK